ncbi:MAG TPA: response regulator [Leptolinea sp.]
MTNILIVDDEVDILDVVADELASHGYQVAQANDGVEAVLKFLTHRPDFVVMDIRMPRLNGIDALNIMKTIDAHVPVITFTGQAGRGEMAESSRLGALTCLAKPLLPSQVFSIIENHLKDRLLFNN